MTGTYEVVPKAVDDAIVRPPGSKSITNRALIAAALAPGRSALIAPLLSEDTEAMTRCLTSMGVSITSSEDGLVVESTGQLIGGGRMDAGASGTTARFVTAAATVASGPGVIDGSDRMRQRPIGHLVDALVALGADLTSSEGSPPVHIAGGGLSGGRVVVDASLSSQFVSAVMLIAPRAQQAVTIDVGDEVVSRPYITTTMEVMRAFGAVVEWQGTEAICVESTGYLPADFMVEADASAAIYPWAAAAVTASTITVVGIDPSSTQADVRALRVLGGMGCKIDRSPAGIAVTGPHQLAGVSVDMNDCPDAVLAVSVIAAFASSPTNITNVANLRLKETDRLRALETELTKLGAKVVTGPDHIRIEPGLTRPARIATYEDHRIAMSFAVAGLRQPGVIIEDPDCVAKTWPEFFEMLESL